MGIPLNVIASQTRAEIDTGSRAECVAMESNTAFRAALDPVGSINHAPRDGSRYKYAIIEAS